MEDNLDAITKAITLANDCIGIDARYETKKVMDRLLTISAVGVLVKDLISIATPKRPNAVLQKLNQLDRKLGELSEKMSHLFADLKSFMVEHDFYRTISSPAATLLNYMQNTISRPCEDTKNLFRAECERTPPLRLAREFMNQLSHDSTNPLKMAMKADPLKTRQTFNKWRGIIDGVLAQFLYLETYLNGMFWNQNMIGPQELEKEIKALKTKMNQWYEDYHDQNEGWEGVQQLVYDIQDNYTHVGNHEKSDILQRRLDNILSNNAFYVLVYNDCGGYGNHAFRHNTNNFICSFRRGKCNVVISRTFRFNDRGSYARKLKDAIQNRPPYPTLDSYQSFIKTLRDEAGQKGECGFVGMIRASNNVAIRWVNCDPNDVPNGPGAFTHVETSTVAVAEGFFGGRMIHGDKFLVIAGIR